MLNHKASVFLVAENRLLRESLARLLNKSGNLNVCGASPCTPNTTPSVAESRADILILDPITARLPNFAYISEIVGQVPSIKVVLIDMDFDPEVFLESVRAGAMGYMLRDASAAEIMAGVLAVAQGQAICPQKLCFYLFRAFSRQSTAIPSARMKIELGLTRRQQQVIPLISRGLTNKEIGSHLNISEQTVKNHIHNIMRRLGANDRLQVIDQTRLWSAFQ